MPKRCMRFKQFSICTCVRTARKHTVLANQKKGAEGHYTQITVSMLSSLHSTHIMRRLGLGLELLIASAYLRHKLQIHTQAVALSC